MEAKMWSGLVTNASPYAIPPGAATVQENLHCRIPGKLATRGGMRLVLVGTGQSPPANITSFYPYMHNGTCKLVALLPNGSVDVVVTPQNGPATTSPLDPALSPNSGEVDSNYVGKFYAYGEEAP